MIFGPLYMLSPNSHAKWSTVESSRNFWPTELGEFLKKIHCSFIFHKWHFNLFLGPVYMPSTSFHAKTLIKNSGKKIFTWRTTGHFGKNILKFVFFFQRFFHLFLGPLYMLSTSYQEETLHWIQVKISVRSDLGALL